MALDFGWSPTTVGLDQSAFFYGYLASQLPGGVLVERLGGLSVLPAGVLTWSATGMSIPAVAANFPLMFLARGVIGLGEGVSPPAAINIIANTFPPEERSRATALTFGGLSVGSILGLLVSPFLIQNVGWPPVFILFGGAGLVWCLWFEASGIKGELERLSGAGAAPPLLGEDGAGGPRARRRGLGGRRGRGCPRPGRRRRAVGRLPGGPARAGPDLHPLLQQLGRLHDARMAALLLQGVAGRGPRRGRLLRPPAPLRGGGDHLPGVQPRGPGGQGGRGPHHGAQGLPEHRVPGARLAAEPGRRVR